MINFSESVVAITNGVFYGNNKNPESTVFYLSDYADTAELMQACRNYFEDNGKNHYTVIASDNVPAGFIIDGQLLQQFFELREALVPLDEDERELFFDWCRYNNRDCVTEDIFMLVTHFRETYMDKYPSEPDEYLSLDPTIEIRKKPTDSRWGISFTDYYES
ncbi:MAG: hypothetical protein LIO77_05485 [Rikenellaceae bacterium]|nr:hypothetical protein [Rikenellaceae bacterium]